MSKSAWAWGLGLVVVGWMPLCVGWMPLCADDQEKKPVNLVANPSFEQTETLPVGWSLGGIAEGGRAKLSVSEEKPKSGQRCIRITGEAEWATFVGNRIPVEKGKYYVLTGWVRVKKGTGYIKIDYFDKDKWLDMTMPEGTDSPEWIQQKVQTEADKLEKATHITATLVGAGEFEVDFDDIVIEAKPVQK